MAAATLLSELKSYKTAMNNVTVRSSLTKRDSAYAANQELKKYNSWPEADVPRLFNVATVDKKIHAWNDAGDVRLYDSATLEYLGKGERMEEGLHQKGRVIAESNWFVLFEHGSVVLKKWPKDSTSISGGRPVTYAGVVPSLEKTFLIWDSGTGKFKLCKLMIGDWIWANEIPLSVEKVLCAGGGVVYAKLHGEMKVRRYEVRNVNDKYVLEASPDGPMLEIGYNYLLHVKVYHVGVDDVYAVQNFTDNTIELFYGATPQKVMAHIPIMYKIKDLRRVSKGTFLTLVKSDYSYSKLNNTVRTIVY